MPNVGDPAPDFSLPASDGKTYSLSQFRGQRHVVLVFYPGDDTPTCTAQLCDYRDGWDEFQKLDAVILGVSTNDMTAHKKFAEKFSFPFPLLEDKGNQLCKAYGALMLGGLLPVANRAVFIIDKQGVIRYRHVETIPIFKRSRAELLDELRKIAA
ncbi:MAG: peroxiredoxin [Chloracidobacterium sp. CP2_5A]|nr:MAG: peroxiredoxin [Chloracidobacterium sp. CP2_5A]